ncbi:RNA-binding S4 domain-containing protein [Prochlorococcus marinus]|uniref:RNA-binding S4 domain-containing protein n=1 Tax=Prochlorococcus marinus TaxID=1219 RepID=UPI0022B42AD6|nr:RNA-binding S4 domain-containing protein [Prochlorococcus marinus]
MKLDQFLKWIGVAGSGGQAKHLISGGHVAVNGFIETRRGRQLRQGDLVSLANNEYIFSNNQPLGRKLDNSD